MVWICDDSSEILLPHSLQVCEVILLAKEGEMKSLCGLQILLGVEGSLEQQGPVLGAFRTCKHCASSTNKIPQEREALGCTLQFCSKR